MIRVMPNDSRALIDADHAAFIQRGISIDISSCGHDRLPVSARAIGCCVSDDHRTLTILVSERQAEAVVAGVRQRGVLAVSFSEPSTHRTVQLKGSDAVVASASSADLAHAARYRGNYTRELGLLGYNPDLIFALLSCPDDDVVAISFTPNAAFSQTPGPNAGQALLVHA